MKLGPALFRIFGAVLFVQLLLGGLLTFDFIGATLHIVVGLLLLVLAVATMIVSLVSKPAFRPAKISSIVLVILIVVQGILGFATLRSGSAALAWIHFVTAMAIYGASVSSTFAAMRWNKMAKETQAPSAPTANQEQK